MALLKFGLAQSEEFLMVGMGLGRFFTFDSQLNTLAL